MEIVYGKFIGANQNKWFAWISRCLDRGSQRRALSELDDHLLRDIGISRLQALREAGKPFWRA
jgi:uncharacterized protein YjiS (DUF1127 family)